MIRASSKLSTRWRCIAKETSLVPSTQSLIGLKIARRLCHSHSRCLTSHRASALLSNKIPASSGCKGLIPRHSQLSSANRSASTTVQTDDSTSSTRVVPYSAPTTGLLAYLPASWVPYAELARLDKPAGTYYLFFPCLFSTLLASSYTAASPVSMISTSLLFATGALIMRGAGCTVNDLWDRNLDPHVARTRLRPLARKAVTPASALVFAGAQCLAGLVVLLQLPQPECFLWGAPSLLLVGTYPLAKRVTYYPQVVLGFTFSWGALMGFPAMGVDLLTDQAAAQAAGLLYASCISWTVLYDMIYAHMDIKDDRKVGIKSIALAHETSTKSVLAGLAVVQTGLLAAAGAATGAGPLFYLGSCGGALGTLSWMIWRVKLKDAANCWWWFRYGSWLTGGAISAGLLAEYTFSRSDELAEKAVKST